MEIKYRAFDTETGKYYDGSDLKDFTGNEDGSLILNCNFGGMGSRMVFEQYVEIKDKNGNELFEGDIVFITNYKQNWKHGEPNGNWKIFEVKRNKYVFALNNYWIYKPLSDYDTSDLMGYDIEIIGNVHQNRELLANPD